ncbi:MAG: 2-C-methyl-D-erythritol 4-phosphate cytidylyltransferase, partial [Thermodesulfovibrionales bacterium]|nr:2-C-methyl-D-erythritol 4-phosphate cytidylyltransferase [Thermodesulfovibrionales bacterium]
YGTRFGGDKLLSLLDDKPVIIHSLLSLNSIDRIFEIVVVTRDDLIKPIWKLVERFKIKKVRTIIEGGRERQDSVYEGLKAVMVEPQLIIIHDGARPLIKKEIIEEAISKLLSSYADGIVVGMPVKDTIKEVSEQVDLIVKKTLDRSCLWMAQTPQIFYYKRLFESFKRAYEDNFYSTDDSALVEQYGGKVIMIEGGYDNIKITTPDDLYQAISLIKQRDI